MHFFPGLGNCLEKPILGFSKNLNIFKSPNFRFLGFCPISLRGYILFRILILNTGARFSYKSRAIAGRTARCRCNFVNFDKKNLQRHRAVSVPQHGFPVRL